MGGVSNLLGLRATSPSGDLEKLARHRMMLRTVPPRVRIDRSCAIPLWRSGVDMAGYVILGTPSSSNNRSEEHTTEIQSLMRISYAVFCLKKKKKQYI